MLENDGISHYRVSDDVIARMGKAYSQGQIDGLIMAIGVMVEVKVSDKKIRAVLGIIDSLIETKKSIIDSYDEVINA